MVRNLMNRLFNRETNTSQSMIQPNDRLNLSELSKYTQVMTSKDDTGYKGLKTAFDNKQTVAITIANSDKSTTVIKGIISHYDENYEQLLVNMNSQLKRIVFTNIVDVEILEEDTSNLVQEVEESKKDKSRKLKTKLKDDTTKQNSAVKKETETIEEVELSKEN